MTMTRSLLRTLTICAIVLTLMIIYRFLGFAPAMVYFCAVALLLFFYFNAQPPRAKLRANLAKLAAAIEARFEDYGALFNGEGMYQGIPVGFREKALGKASEFEVYCRPGSISHDFDGKFVNPSEKTVLRQGRVLLKDPGALFMARELDDNDIIDVLQELRVAAWVVEEGRRPYRAIVAKKVISTLSMLVVILLCSCALLTYKIIQLTRR